MERSSHGSPVRLKPKAVTADGPWMTSTLDATRSADHAPIAAASGGPTSAEATNPLSARPRLLSSVVVALGGVVLWVVAAHAFGGRDPGAATLAVLAAIPLLLLGRPWHLPPVRWTAVAPGLLAALGLLASPTGAAGLDEACGLLLAGLVVLGASGWLQRGGPAWALLAPLAAGALAQLWTGVWAWIGSGGVTGPMVGGFYWHNQFGAFMLGCATLFGTFTIHASGMHLLRLLTGLTSACAAAGVLFSGSRACIALLIVAACGLILTVVRCPARITPLAGIAAGTLVLAEGLAALVPGGADATTALDERGQSASGNAAARWDYWIAAVRILRTQPWTGSGADSFAVSGPDAAGAPFVAPTGWVHNSALQIGVDSGLIVMLAAIACVGAALIVWGRRLLIDSRLLRPGQVLDPLTLAGGVATCAMVLHALVDLDGASPVLLALLGLCLALAMYRADSRTTRGSGDRGRTSLGAVLVGLALGTALIASSGLDAAAATGADVPGWQRLVTGGLAQSDGSGLDGWLLDGSPPTRGSAGGQ